jgi:hypothetical protein
MATQPGLQETLTIINTYYQLPEAAQIFGPRMEIFRKVTSGILDNFKTAEQNKEVCPASQLIKDIRQLILFLKATLLDMPLTADYGKFLQSFCLLLTNWSNNIGKLDDVTIDSKLIHRQTQMHFSTAELLESVKIILQRVKSLQSFAMPTIELSRHYLNSMDKPNGATTFKTEGPLLPDVRPEKAPEDTSTVNILADFTFNKKIL